LNLRCSSVFNLAPLSGPVSKAKRRKIAPNLL
jgi:hypothetical protein